jgi:hypothetical protein
MRKCGFEGKRRKQAGLARCISFSLALGKNSIIVMA